MKTPIRILALDGGGVGGVSPARLVQRLTAEFPDLIARTDLVAGTSTGGLIALGLANGQDTETLPDLYLNEAQNIFGPANRRLSVWDPFYAKYVPTGLRQV